MGVAAWGWGGDNAGLEICTIHFISLDNLISLLLKEMFLSHAFFFSGCSSSVVLRTGSYITQIKQQILFFTCKQKY